MKLGRLIERLSAADPNTIVKSGFAEPTSYRGYYDQVAFVPAGGPTTVGAMLRYAKAALVGKFEGYKGGYYKYDLDTEAWFADWGETSPDDEPISEEDVDGWLRLALPTPTPAKPTRYGIIPCRRCAYFVGSRCCRGPVNADGLWPFVMLEEYGCGDGLLREEAAPLPPEREPEQEPKP